MSRRELREHIFRLLFCVDFHDRQEMSQQGQLYIEALKHPDETSDAHIPDDEDTSYILEKTAHIVDHLEELDQKVNDVATGWKTTRMGRVDLTIIRLALYEMLYDEDVPTGVAINEAVELAKKYGSDESPSFVNGILARLV